MKRLNILLLILGCLTLAGLIVTVLIQSNRIDRQRAEIDARDREISDLRSEVDTTRARLIQMKAEIEAATKRIDAAITVMTKGEKDARQKHEMRLDEIFGMDDDPDTHDWLCEPVPDDVCMLFKDYADM